MDYNDYVTDTKQSEFQNWLNNFDNMLSQWYTDPANEQDDIDRIYRQQEIEEWISLLEAYGRGEVEYNTLINWRPDYLSDIDGFNDYLDDIRTKATWERNTNFNIGYCEENGCRDPAMQRFYDKWVRSGQPTTKDGMMSDEDFDKYTAVPNEVDGIIEILRNEGYSDEDIQDLLDSIVDDDDFYGSTVLSNVLRDLGYYEAGEQWDVSPRPGSPCTAEDGTIGQYDNVGGCVSRGIGSEGDPCGYRGEGQKDATGNCVGGEDNCDNPTYAADREEECAEPLTEEEELVRDYGQEAVDKAKEIYNGIEDWVEGTIEDPLGALKNILDTVYSGMPEECKESTTDKPDDWWKDCTNLSVLGQIPGLPIPLPPGTIDVNTTVRDLENAAIEAGKTLEDIFNPTCTGTPAEIEECENRTISDIIGDWASDVWDSIKGAWEDLEDKTEEGLLNILIDAGYNILSGWILTEIKDAITLEDPLAFFPIENCNNPEWREQATAQQLALCNSAVNCEEQGLTGGYVKDVDLCGPPINGYCEDGVTAKDDAEGTNCEEYSQFGFCEDGTKKVDQLGTNCEEYAEFGLCEDGTKKVDQVGTNCEEYAEFGFCEDEVTKKVDTKGTNCAEYTEPFDCSSVGREAPEGDVEATSANDCGSCIDTSLEPNNVGNCEEPGVSQEEQDCIDKGRIWDGVTETCEENCVNTQHVVDPQTGECGPAPFVNPGPDEATCASRGKSFVPANETTDPPTPSSCGDCVEEGWTHDGVGTTCADPNPDPNNCAAQNKTLNEDKSCGDCTQEGFTPTGPNGECVAPKECKEGNEDTTVTEEIAIPYGTVPPRRPPTYEDNGTQCVMTTYTYFTEDPTSDQCTELDKVLSEDGKTCVDPPEEQPCANNAVDTGTCEDCGDGSTPSQHVDGDCKKPKLVTEDGCGPDTFTQERTVEVSVGAGEPQEPTTQYTVEDGACTKVTTVYVKGPTMGPPNCADGKPPEVEGGECVECPEGSQYPNASSLAECGAPPPGECQDPEANNVGQPLPCTYDPSGECQDPNANNQGQPLPCTFDPCPGGAQRDENNECPGNLCPDGSQRDADGNCPGDLCPDGSQRDADGNCSSTGCIDNPQTDDEKIDCGYKRCETDGPLVPQDTVCGDGCVDNPQTFMEKVDCGWTVCPDGITVVEDANECGAGCLNGALDYPDCLVCPGGELPDAETGCGGGGGCDDPVFAAENPLECPGVCDTCACEEYAIANPEECFSSPPPPPPPPPPPEGGGGGSGGGGNAQLKQLSITGDPELLARQEFPITDYLSGLFTGRG